MAIVCASLQEVRDLLLGRDDLLAQRVNEKAFLSALERQYESSPCKAENKTRLLVLPDLDGT